MSCDPDPKTTVEAAIRIADAVVNDIFYKGQTVGKIPPDYRPAVVAPGRQAAFRALRRDVWQHEMS